ncbi:MAG: DNA polymerase III subunit delta' [Dongiaceae bacterium]
MAGDEQEILEPRRNSYFRGHDHAEAAILRTWSSGRVPHAWLITGPRGIGKATLAYRFARLALGGQGGGEGLFGEKAPSLQVEPDSPVFRQIAAGAHPDLMVIERGYDEKNDRLRTEIVVSDIRRAVDFLHLKSAMGGWRVVIVDYADDMNRNSANALLKILEEPPQRALLLLVSHAPGRLLPTIRSRCRRLELAPLPDAIVGELVHHYEPELEPAAVRQLTEIAGGSIGRALSVASAGGLAIHAELNRQLSALPNLPMGEIHAFAEKVGKSGGESPFELASELLLIWLGRVVRHRATGAGRPPSAVASSRGSLEQWLALWEKTNSLFKHTDTINLDRKQVWIGAMVDIAQLTAAR